MAHLWEHNHPFYGDETDSTDVGSLAELKELLAGHPHDGTTVIYRWDWLGPHSRYADPDDPERLVVYGLFPRIGHTWSLSCPVSKDQEDEVRDWLTGPDVLGQLAPVWAPLLVEDTRSETLSDVIRAALRRYVVRNAKRGPGQPSYTTPERRAVR